MKVADASDVKGVGKRQPDSLFKRDTRVGGAPEVEDRLIEQARREGRVAARGDQRELSLAYRAVEGGCCREAVGEGLAPIPFK